ncbi:hypothetical protein SDC9_157749 [bioreactor metagenome]|uniref:Uncharacterized protein n=1 Tax=bioreactor metagenome TaxID=1076179 RepID=A0A645FD76_9ZZZZ
MIDSGIGNILRGAGGFRVGRSVVHGDDLRLDFLCRAFIRRGLSAAEGEKQGDGCSKCQRTPGYGHVPIHTSSLVDCHDPLAAKAAFAFNPV